MSTKPKSAPRLKPGTSGLSPASAVKRATLLLERMPSIYLVIEERITGTSGPGRRVSVLAFLSLGIALTMLKKDMLMSEMTGLIYQLGHGQRIDLGLVRPDGDDISYRQIEHVASQIAKAYDRDETSHAHPVLDENTGFVVDPQSGEIVADTNFLTEAETTALCSCPPECPARDTITWIMNRILTRMGETFGIPTPETFALDSYGIDTHNRPRAFGGLADINPDYVPETDTKNRRIVEEIAAQNAAQQAPTGKKGRREVTAKHRRSAQDQITNWNQQPEPPRNPKSRRPKPIGPVADGDFNRDDPTYPQISPKDNRLRPTVDPDAATGYRSKPPGHPSGFVTGRDTHTLIDSGVFPNGIVRPPLLYCSATRPAGSDKIAPARYLMQTANSNGANSGLLSLDRGYTSDESDGIIHIGFNNGFRLVHEMKGHQLGVKEVTPKALFIDGFFFTKGTPTNMLTIKRWTPGTPAAKRMEIHRSYDQRNSYALQIHSETDTHIRFRGPSTFDAVLDHNGQLISYRKDRLTARCPNHPQFALMPTHLPKTHCKPGTKCYCAATFTIAKADLPNCYEPLIFGTTDWAQNYFRRNLVETANSIAEYHHKEGKHTYRVNAQKWDLFRMMFAIGLNLSVIHTWMLRMGVHRRYTHDPATTKAIIAPLLLPPEPEPETKRKRKPPDDPPTPAQLP